MKVIKHESYIYPKVDMSISFICPRCLTSVVIHIEKEGLYGNELCDCNQRYQISKPGLIDFFNHEQL